MNRPLHVQLRSIQIPGVAITRCLPLAILLLMVGAFFLLDGVLPLKGIASYDALLEHLGSWVFFPTHLLFPGRIISLLGPGTRLSSMPMNLRSWKETGLLAATFFAIFLIYLLALRYLPRWIGRRYLLASTLLLGLTWILIPAVTSLDVFSYIAYARIGIIYHLNPLTTLPLAVSHDPVYPYLNWVNQPSAYGPTWTLITCAFQWVLGLFGAASMLRMLLMLRLFGLATHLGSTWLIWSLIGRLQRGGAINWASIGSISPEQRMRATLAFAWNPLLLFEACVNAHNDATLLLLILLTVWFLVRTTPPTLPSYLFAAALFALATCLKLNVVLFAPGLLLFFWSQTPRRILWMGTVTSVFLGIMLLLYLPFWQGGAVLNVFRVNPATYRNGNSLAEFASHLYNSLAHVPNVTPRLTPNGPITSPSEHVTHTLSIALFLLIYAILCWRAMRGSERITGCSDLIRWMSVVWLLYCAIGSPWFWPWYLVTFFGLFALLEACQGASDKQAFGRPQGIAPTFPSGEGRSGETSLRFANWSFGFLNVPLAVRLLAFSMLSLYCFYTLAPLHSVVLDLSGTYFRGLYIWLLPLLAVRFSFSRKERLPDQFRKLSPLGESEVPAMQQRGANADIPVISRPTISD